VKFLRLERGALACALFAVATLAVSACSGGGASVGPSASTSSSSGSGSGSGAGSGSGNGSGGSATSSPGASGGSGSGSGSGGSATPSPSASATSSASSGGSATATPTPASTPASLDSLSVVPAVVDGDLGGVAQIGVLDPNYTGAYNVTVSGGGLLGNTLSTLGNVVNGTLAGSSAGETTLSLNLANAVQLGLLGPSGNVVTICEQQSPSTCKSVNITNNGVVPQVGSNLSSIVFSSSGLQTIQLLAPGFNLAMFYVSSTPQGITVTNLGDGMYQVSAMTNMSVPFTGSITITNGTQTITIPVSVL
jgi:hypothetical protein